jgi:CheY-like chemotaxis protein
MSVNLCPACRQVNEPGAKRCLACSASLRGSDTVILPLRPTAPPRDLAGVLWLDDLMAPKREAPVLPPPAPAPVPVPAPAVETELSITLREIDAPPADGDIPVVVATLVEDLVVSGPGVEVPVLRDAVVHRSRGNAPPADPVWQAEQRAAKRASVRRARLRSNSGPASDEPAVPEVLVLDADDAARDQLCTLLRAFGFGVHSVADAGKAALLVASRPFVAAFVDIVLDASDGGAGIDLCKHIKAPAAAGRPTAMLVLVAAQLRPVDRVRAGLAGCDEMLAKPVTRGSVARLLDARGIALPSDARRI